MGGGREGERGNCHDVHHHHYHYLCNSFIIMHIDFVIFLSWLNHIFIKNDLPKSLPDAHWSSLLTGASKKNCDSDRAEGAESLSHM